MHCYFLPETQDKFRVEKGLETLLTGDLENKTDQLLKIYHNLDRDAQAAFMKLLKDKKNFQQEFAEMMQLRVNSTLSSPVSHPMLKVRNSVRRLHNSVLNFLILIRQEKI